jgi:hypothetical protein
MPKVKRKHVGDVGIRLKPIETNLLENYNEFSNRRNKTRNKKKRKKTKKPKRDVTKSIEIHDKVDPLFKIMEESKDKPKGEIEIKELSDVEKEKKSEKIDKSEKVEKDEENKEEPIFKKIRVQEGKRDISEKDPNIKSLKITAPLEPDKKKKGHHIKLE